MGGEARARLHPILVDDAQAAEAHVARVEVVGEREGVAAREPAELRAAALGARADGDHGVSIPAAPGDATFLGGSASAGEQRLSERRIDMLRADPARDKPVRAGINLGLANVLCI